jgi:hypothetical protein
MPADVMRDLFSDWTTSDRGINVCCVVSAAEFHCIEQIDKLETQKNHLDVSVPFVSVAYLLG